MALSTATNKQTFTATAGDTEFTFDIPFFDAITIEGKKYGDIKLTREDTAGNLTQFTPKESFTNPDVVDGEFKLTPTNNDPDQGGTVTISKAAAGGEKFVVERDVAYTQQYDLQEGSTIDPTALNKALDRVVAQNQQQNDLFTRTVEFPVTDNPSRTYTVGSETERANKALGFDASGNVTEINLVDAGQISSDTNAGISISNNIISAKVDNSTTQFSGGNIAVKTVGASELGSNAVSTGKIQDDAVTNAKIADNAVQTPQIQDNAVTHAKYQDLSDMRVVGNVVGDNVARSPQGVEVEKELGFVSPDHDTLATAKGIKAYVDINFNTVFSIIKAKKEINNGNSMTVRQFYGVPDLTAAITTKKSNATYKIDFSLSFGSNLFGYETAVKIMYKVGSGSYQDFQVPIDYGSRTPTQFSHYCGDGDARMNNISSTIFLDDATYNVGDVITFQPFIAGVRDSSGLKIDINAAQHDPDDNEYSRGVSTLIVQEF